MRKHVACVKYFSVKNVKVIYIEIYNHYETTSNYCYECNIYYFQAPKFY